MFSSYVYVACSEVLQIESFKLRESLEKFPLRAVNPYENLLTLRLHMRRWQTATLTSYEISNHDNKSKNFTKCNVYLLVHASIHTDGCQIGQKKVELFKFTG